MHPQTPPCSNNNIHVRTQIFILLNILVASFLFVPVVHACDPTGCLMLGKEQDILAIVTVVSTEGEIATVTADHFNKVSRIKPTEMFQIDFSSGTPWSPLVPEVGKHYFTSLACEDLFCRPKWGTWEVDSTDYQHAKLTNIRWGDDAAVEWFMNEKEGQMDPSNTAGAERIKWVGVGATMILVLIAAGLFWKQKRLKP